MATIDKKLIIGLEGVLKNLSAKSRELERKLDVGLKRAGLFLQRESQKVVPVDTGNLKASAYTRAQGRGMNRSVIVGYTAAYAIWVHEAVGMILKGKERTGKGHGGRYWDPQGRAQAKFLEEPVRRLSPKLRAIIKEAMQL